MNICIFSTVTYWHGLRGGMDLHGKHLLEGLSGRSHNVIVISTKHPSGKEYEEINIRWYDYRVFRVLGGFRKPSKNEISVDEIRSMK